MSTTVYAQWNDAPGTGTLKVTAGSCNISSENGSTKTNTYTRLSVFGLKFCISFSGLISFLFSWTSMKKWAVFAVCLFCLRVDAQELPKGPVIQELYPRRFISELEFLVGPALIIAGGDATTINNRVPWLGFSFGVAAVRKITSKFAMGIKVSYEDKGLRSIYYSVNYDYNPPAQQKSVQDIKLRYGLISILPRYWIIKRPKIYISAGPYFGYLVSERYYTELYIDGKLVTKYGSRPDPDLYYKKFDFGLTAGALYSFTINKKRNGCVQFFYNHGFLEVNKPTLFPVIRNTTYALLLGISLNRSNR